MNIGLASKEFINNDIKGNLKTICIAMKEAKKKNCQLICFGEAFLQGFDALCWDYEFDQKVALEKTSTTIQKICEESKRIGIDVLFGYLEKEKESIYSSYALVENGTITHNYRRISKGWKEVSKTDSHYQEGNEANCFVYQNKKICIALCGDLWFYPKKYLLGEDILIWPIYTDFSIKEWEKIYENEYCEQASSYGKVLMVNSFCYPTGNGGAYYFENKKIVASLKPGKKGILVVKID